MVQTAQQFQVLGGNKTPFSADGVDKPVFFQLLIRALGRNDADLQVFGELADRRQGVALVQLPVDNLFLDLPRDLLVDR